jgi:hypothetical protein
MQTSVLLRQQVFRPATSQRQARRPLTIVSGEVLACVVTQAAGQLQSSALQDQNDIHADKIHVRQKARQPTRARLQTCLHPVKQWRRDSFVVELLEVR